MSVSPRLRAPQGTVAALPRKRALAPRSQGDLGMGLGRGAWGKGASERQPGPVQPILDRSV